jgi:hypothetical protein
MKKAMLSYAVGESHKKMHSLTIDSKNKYAERFGYDFFVPEITDQGRPASWEKINLLISLLQEYDQVLFLGCDILIVNHSQDISDQVPVEAWQALVVHDVESMPGAARVGYIPNCDMWIVKPKMLPVLKQIESMSTQLRDHGWWEQAALMQLMGFNLNLPCFRQNPTPLWKVTYELDPRWNYHPYAKCVGEPFFKHATGYDIPTRLIMLESWL